MADDSEWTKLPTEDKCLHKVGSVTSQCSRLLIECYMFEIVCCGTSD